MRDGLSFVPPLEKAFKALDGKIDSDTLTPGQSSYNAELTQAFANKPQVIVDSMDSQTAATLFTDGQQLGYMKVSGSATTCSPLLRVSTSRHLVRQRHRT